MIERENIAVVMPFHKPDMRPEEIVSLRCARDRLGGYPRFMAVGESLDISAFRREDPALQFVRFPDTFFANWIEYNALLRSAFFYEAFREYAFMLIYQLDCYVFRDELREWCERGYDYLGAAWPHYEHVTSSRKKIARLPFIRLLMKQTAQGGFSLRRIATLREASRRQAWTLRLFRALPEDVYWSTLGSRLHRRFRLPDLKDAMAFAFDASPAWCYEQTGDRLPFGCHGWFGPEAAFWKDKIPS